MPKDNESIPLLTDLSVEAPESRGFAPEEMVRCEDCLRANPPTRLTCLYCNQALPVAEEASSFVRPALRRLEKWELGYSNILIPSGEQRLSSELLGQAAGLLRLDTDICQRIFSATVPLPLTHTAAAEEATLVRKRLGDWGIETMVVADQDLGIEAPVDRVRSLELGESYLGVQTAKGPLQIPWSEIDLIVVTRLFVKRIELKERKRRGENEILDSSETSSDEAVMDIYRKGDNSGWRVTSKNFDFSCLGEHKTLIASQNFTTLVNCLRESSSGAEYDDSFNSLRPLLDPVWPCERQTQSGGWQREWLGKISTGGVITTNNEAQFLRYSRLRHYLQSRPSGRIDEGA